VLDIERAVFEKLKPKRFATYPGQIVVIKGEEVVGLFPTIQDALSEAVRRFGLQDILVREIAEPFKVSVPALSLGLLHADSAFSDSCQR
jgi:hypothetical protein